jgi:hypothetical protein
MHKRRRRIEARSLEPWGCFAVSLRLTTEALTVNQYGVKTMNDAEVVNPNVPQGIKDAHEDAADALQGLWLRAVAHMTKTDPKLAAAVLSAVKSGTPLRVVFGMAGAGGVSFETQHDGEWRSFFRLHTTERASLQ